MTPVTPFTIEGPLLGQGEVCARILAALPDWFGIPEANAHYREAVDGLPALVARVDGEAVGFLAIKQHTPYAAELYVLGVLPDHHRQGIGRAMVERAEDMARDWGVEYMQVKTLGPSHPDPGYAHTRAFYAALGYRPLEELLTLWDECNPCLMQIKRL